MRVSIVVLTCNGLDDTRLCIRSLLADGFADKEILLWDNGSAQDEAIILGQEFGSAITTTHRSPTNVGTSAAYNAALPMTTGDIVIYLNNDVEVSAGWLHPLIAAFDDPSVGVCTPKSLSWHEPLRFDYASACGGFVDALGYPFARGRIFWNVEEDQGQYDDVIDVEWGGPCLAFRRTVLQQIGGFDASLFAYMEDIDACWRVRNLGHRMLCVPASVIRHKGGVTWRYQLVRKTYYQHRNNLQVLCKNMPRTDVLKILPLRYALDLVTCVYYVIHGQILPGITLMAVLPWLYVRSLAFLRTAGPRTLPRYRGSIVLQFFVRGKHRWNELMQDTPRAVSKLGRKIFSSTMVFLRAALLWELLMILSLQIPSALRYLPNAYVDIVGFHYMRHWRDIYQDATRATYDPQLTYTLLPGEHAFRNAEFSTTVTINSAGLRDDEASLIAPKIIVLGDSHAMGWGVENAQTFAQILERKAGRTVLNAAVSSYATVREMTSLDRLDTSALRTLIIAYSDNDVTENQAYADHENVLPISTEQEWRRALAAAQTEHQYYPLKLTVMTIRQLLEEYKQWRMSPAPLDPQHEAELFLNALRHATQKDLSRVQIIVLEVSGRRANDNHFVRALQELSATDPALHNLQILDTAAFLQDDDFFILDDHLNAHGHAAVEAAIEELITPPSSPPPMPHQTKP